MFAPPRHITFTSEQIDVNNKIIRNRSDISKLLTLLSADAKWTSNSESY